MRTTITLDDDVAAELERLRRDGNRNFKEVVNDTLRAGLRSARTRPAEWVHYTRPRDVGGSPDVSDVSAVLGMLDDEKYAYLAEPGRP